VSKALVYYYFPTHRDLQAAVVRQAADELLAAIRSSVVLPAADPGTQLTAGLDAAIGYIEEQPEAFAALARSAGFHPKLYEVFEYARDGVAEVLAEGVGLTDLTERQRMALRSWIALTEEAVLHWVLAGKPVPREELVAFCQTIALAVLTSPFATADVNTARPSA
jgi:AcrR family transcriptional regulator